MAINFSEDEWEQIQGQMSSDSSWEFSQDPILGLPKTPYQSAQIDPAQDPFQYPFQFPSQDPVMAGQYSPVDLPENQLQQIPNPPNQPEYTTSPFDEFDPHNSLVSNAIEIGKAWAEQQGFDLGVFGKINFNDSLIGNAWNIGKEAMSSETGGDLGQMFGGVAGDIAEGIGNFLDTLGDAFNKLDENLGFALSGADLGEGAAADATSAIKAVAGAGAEAEAVVSPVVAQTTEIAAAGIDLAAPEIATGKVVEAVGADVLPSAVEALMSIIKFL
jgi:hypothetical protein